MAVNTSDSNLVANADASPPVMNPVGKQGGRVRIIQDNFEVAAEDVTDIGDIIRLARVPVNARIHSIQIANDDLDSGAGALAADLGIYDPNNGNAVKDADAFASAIGQLAAATAFGTELRWESGVNGIDTLGKKLWELAGDSEDPGGEYDIALTLTAGASTPAAGTIAFIILYVVD